MSKGKTRYSLEAIIFKLKVLNFVFSPETQNNLREYYTFKPTPRPEFKISDEIMNKLKEAQTGLNR